MIAGEQAEAAAVDRQRVLQTEFRREVSDMLRDELRPLLGDPRPYPSEPLVEGEEHGVVTLQNHRICGRLDESLFGDLVQQLDRVVLGIVPESRIEGLEERPRLVVPAPPEVVSELLDARDTRWNLAFGH